MWASSKHSYNIFEYATNRWRNSSMPCWCLSSHWWSQRSNHGMSSALCRLQGVSQSHSLGLLVQMTWVQHKHPAQGPHWLFPGLEHAHPAAALRCPLRDTQQQYIDTVSDVCIDHLLFVQVIFLQIWVTPEWCCRVFYFLCCPYCNFPLWFQ